MHSGHRLLGVALILGTLANAPALFPPPWQGRETAMATAMSGTITGMEIPATDRAIATSGTTLGMVTPTDLTAAEPARARTKPHRPMARRPAVMQVIVCDGWLDRYRGP